MPSLLTAMFLLTASPDQAGPEPPTLEQGIAVAIARAMPDIRYPWQLDWSAFGNYASRDIRWNLTGPRDDARPSDSPRVTRRTGWIEVRGASASVAACGDDDRVGAMMIETNGFRVGDGDLTAELAEAGVVATLLEQQDLPALLTEPGADDLPRGYAELASARPAYQLMRLEQSGREPALLSASYVCTPPGTRSATRCTIHWVLELRAGPSGRPEPCIAPAAPVISSVRLD